MGDTSGSAIEQAGAGAVIAAVEPSRPHTVEARKGQTEKIHALTSLRFFAALYVVLYHTLWFAIPSLTASSIGGRILSLGYLSVSFFFLLSGYILSIVYLRDGRPIAKRNFYIARFARVYPLFFFTLVAGTPFLIVERIHKYGLASALSKTAVTFAGNVVMLQAWFLQLRGINNPNWSLSVETLFYAVFPLLGVWIWRLTRRQVWLVAACVWIASQALVQLAYGHIPEAVGELDPILHLGTFTLGILLGRWQTLRRRESGPSPSGTGTATVALLLSLCAFAGVVMWEPRPALSKLITGFMAPIFVVIVWAFSNNRSLFSRWLSMPWLVVLGEASYGLYLIHFVVYQLFEALGLDKIPLLFPVYLGGCIALSVLSLYFVETPIRKWLLKRFQARPKETMEAASDAQ